MASRLYNIDIGVIAVIIYADVLIILNTYINFILLRLSAFFVGSEISRLRLFAGAFLGGIYSLIILVDGMPDWVSSLLKILSCALIVLISFRHHNVRSFLRSFLSFFVVSFVFAGLMLALWISVSPDTMMYNNGAVYFGFDTMTLLLTTTVCYVVLRAIYFFIEKRTAKASLYYIEIYTLDEVIKCRALLDSGNSLRDYFTSLPVILVSQERLSKVLSEDNFQNKEIQKQLKIRYIPFSTVGGDGVITVFRPKKVRIYGVGCDFETDRILIGESKTKIKNGEFEAILPCDILQEGKLNDKQTVAEN